MDIIPIEIVNTIFSFYVNTSNYKEICALNTYFKHLYFREWLKDIGQYMFKGISVHY